MNDATKSDSKSRIPVKHSSTCQKACTAIGLALNIFQLNVEGLSAAKHSITHILAEWSTPQHGRQCLTQL